MKGTIVHETDGITTIIQTVDLSTKTLTGRINGNLLLHTTDALADIKTWVTDIGNSHICIDGGILC